MENGKHIHSVIEPTQIHAFPHTHPDAIAEGIRLNEIYGAHAYSSVLRSDDKSLIFIDFENNKHRLVCGANEYECVRGSVSMCVDCVYGVGRHASV